MVKGLVRRTPRRYRPKHWTVQVNLVSWLIYSISAILAMSFGVFLYRGVMRVQASQRGTAKFPSESASHLPPKVKLISKNEFFRERLTATTAPQPQIVSSGGIEPSTFAERAEDAIAQVTAPVTSEVEPRISQVAEKPVSESLRMWRPAIDLMVPPEHRRLRPVADTVVSMKARTANGGALTNLAVWKDELYALVKYDVSGLERYTVTKATWVAKMPLFPPPLLGFSTVHVPWEEGTGTLASAHISGASAEWAIFKKQKWHPSGLPLPYAIRGNASSLFCLAQPGAMFASVSTDGWVRIPLEPAIVQALVNGQATGLAISDEHGNMSHPWVFPSREALTDGHYLEVEAVRTDILPPAAFHSVKVEFPAQFRGAKTVGAWIGFPAPGDDQNREPVFAYEVRYGRTPCTFDHATPVPREWVPLPKPPNETQEIVIEGLTPETEYTFFLRALDEVGNASPIAQVSLRTPEALTLPMPSEAPEREGGSITLAGLGYLLDVAEDLELLALKSDQEAKPLPPKSCIWDRSARTIRLRACRNEVVAFGLRLTRTKSEWTRLQMRFDPVSSSQIRWEFRSRFYRVWLCKAVPGAPFSWYGDALIPVPDGLFDPNKPTLYPAAVPLVDFYIEVEVPPSAKDGTYLSRLVFRTPDGATQDFVNVILEVFPSTLPLESPFTIELQTRKDLGTLYRVAAGATQEFRAIVAAHASMAAHHGGIFMPISAGSRRICPSVQVNAGQLSITSWDEWNQWMDPVLDSCQPFSEPPTGARCHMMLPLNQNWPVAWKDAFTCTNDLWITQNGEIYVGQSPLAESCFSAEYWSVMRSTLQAFRHHIHSKAPGCILDVTTADPLAPSAVAPWRLAEPLSSLDFQVLDLFQRTWLAEAEHQLPGGSLRTRVELSNWGLLPLVPQRQATLLIVSDVSDPPPWHLQARISGGEQAWWLRSPGVALEEGPAGVVALILRAYLWGASGWCVSESVGTKDDWLKTSPASLLHSGLPLKEPKPVPSLRLKAIRQASQIIRALDQLEQKQHWARRQTCAFALNVVPSLADRRASPSAAELTYLRFCVYKALKDQR